MLRQAKVVGIDPETGDEYPIDTVKWAKDIRNVTLDKVRDMLVGKAVTSDPAADSDWSDYISEIIEEIRNG